jgi:spore maturation protein SpmA/spore maturation protein SpmB
MALSRFWTTIIVVSIVCLLYSVLSGNQFSLDHILTGNTSDDDPLKRKLVLSEMTKEALEQSDKKTFEAFSQAKPNDKFQKSLKKTHSAVFIHTPQDSVFGSMVTFSYIDLVNKSFPAKENATVGESEFNQRERTFRNAKIPSNIVYCTVTDKKFHLDSVFSYGNTTSDSVLLRRYNMEPAPATAEDMLLRIIKDDNPVICTRDTVFDMKSNGNIIQSTRKLYADGILATCTNVVRDIWIPLLGILVFLCGLMNLLKESKADVKLSRYLSPFFKKIFPELRENHPAFNYMTLNFAANFLGLDNAATPFGLKAMESMQEDNPDKDKASNSQIMFLCLHAAGLTLIPTSIIGYRAVMNASNPADVMVPIIITSFAGTIAALIFVSIRQKINLLNKPVVLFITIATALFAALLVYINRLGDVARNSFTGNLGVGIFLLVIGLIMIYSMFREKQFTLNGTNIFGSFVEGAKEGTTTAFRILPYMIAMLVAINIFRNSGLMNVVMDGLSKLLGFIGVSREVTNAVPVALLRPFSAGGARGFMLDAMQQYGADSLTGRLSCLFEGAAETTFYVIAVYYGSVNVKDTRYTLSIMLLADLVCVLTAAFVCTLWFR